MAAKIVCNLNRCNNLQWKLVLPTFHPDLCRLNKICGGTRTKVRLAIGADVHVFSYNSSAAEQQDLTCHLELSVPSFFFGFAVFIEEMYLEGLIQAGCKTDFVQFGRDILFVTTHLSRKFCGVANLQFLKKLMERRSYHFLAQN